MQVLSPHGMVIGTEDVAFEGLQIRRPDDAKALRQEQFAHMVNERDRIRHVLNTIEQRNEIVTSRGLR